MFHLGWFGTTGPVNWLAPAGAVYDWRKPEIFQDVAKLCERAKMDFVMFADSMAIPSLFQGSTAASARPVATAASTAFPPAERTLAPASLAM